jgi:uncharacterized membrane-anchored protein YjiN (DUF445 family)
MPFRSEAIEEQQRAALRRQRRLATGLLVAMALLFFVTWRVPAPPLWVQLLAAASEAALVGGLADWFAVTALFRHPFGIPIPHTAIVPRNKDRIGDNLGSFVERHFLQPDLLAAKLHSLDLGRRISAWLSVQENAERLARRAAAALPLLLHSLDDAALREFLRRTLRDQMRAANLAPPLGRLLQVMVEARHHQYLFDRALLLATETLMRHEERIYAKVSEKSGWWIPPSIDRTIARKLLTGIYELLEELADHDHEARIGFDRAVHELIDRLQHSTELHDRIDALKHELVENPAVQTYLTTVVTELRRLLIEDIAQPDSRLVTTMTDAFQSLGRNLARDDAMRARLDAALEHAIIELAVPWREEIGRFIAEVVHNWDTETVTERLELAVGRDLQYIRVNGTLVGALVGVVLFLVTRVL